MTYRPPALTRPPVPTDTWPPDVPGPALLLALGQAALMAVLPHGGQRAARRNAWAGMSAVAVRARAQREADDAVAAATHRAEARRRASS